MSHQLLHNPSMTINLLHERKTRVKIKKLTADKRTIEVMRMMTHGKLLCLANIKRKVQEAPLILADMGPPRQPDRLEGPIIQLVRLEGDDKTPRFVEELHEMKKKMGDMKNILKVKAAAI